MRCESLVVSFQMTPHDYDKLTVESVKKILPSVVSIVISKHLPKGNALFQMPFLSPFVPMESDGKGGEAVKIGGGSGVVVHSSGLILTNKHVVFDPDSEYTVILSNGKEYPGKVLSRDPINDIAVLKIDAKELLAAELGNSSSLDLGQTVIAIGNALGMFSNSVSRGIVSGLSRSISASLGTGEETEELRGVIQTDVAINQGNSGGPLIDLGGKIVGINTAVIFGAQNIGFAIPVNWAKDDLKDIVEHGRIIKPYLGLQFIMLTKEMSKKYNLAVDYGALVMKDHVPNSVAVVPHSPAHKAGVRENDIILALNDEDLKGKDLRDLLQKCEVGQEIELTILRGKDKIKVKAKLEERK